MSSCPLEHYPDRNSFDSEWPHSEPFDPVVVVVVVRLERTFLVLRSDSNSTGCCIRQQSNTATDTDSSVDSSRFDSAPVDSCFDSDSAVVVVDRLVVDSYLHSDNRREFYSATVDIVGFGYSLVVVVGASIVVEASQAELHP